MQDDVVAMFALDRWANTKVLDACRKLTAGPNTTLDNMSDDEGAWK